MQQSAMAFHFQEGSEAPGPVRSIDLQWILMLDPGEGVATACQKKKTLILKLSKVSNSTAMP